MFDVKTYKSDGSEGATIRNLSWVQMTAVQSALSQHGVKFHTKQVDEAAKQSVKRTARHAEHDADCSVHLGYGLCNCGVILRRR